jgi:hypothetical protein
MSILALSRVSHWTVNQLSLARIMQYVVCNRRIRMCTFTRNASFGQFLERAVSPAWLAFLTPQALLPTV